MNLNGRTSVGLIIATITVVGLALVSILGAEPRGELAAKGPPAGRVVSVEVPATDEGAAAHRFALDESSEVLWIVQATLDGPPARYSILGYDTKTGTAATYPLPFETALYSPDSTFVAYDGRGRVWMAIDDVFGYFDVAASRFAPVRLPEVARVPEEFAQEGLTTRADDHELARWRTQSITSMAMGADGSIWLTRDHSAVLYRCEPSTGTVDLTDAPPGVDVPGYIRMVGGRATVAESRAVTRAPRKAPEWWVLSEDLEKWESFGAPVCIPVTDGTRAVVTGADGRAGIGLAESPDAVDWLLPRPGADLPVLPHEVIALGADGGLWYVKDALDLARLDIESGAEVVYRLPRTVPSRTPTGGERSSSSMPLTVSPRFETAVVDAAGNLWFSYTAGDTKFGVAYR